MIRYSPNLLFLLLGLVQVFGVDISGNFRGFPPEYICEREGFFASPEDCKDFFRCYIQPKNPGEYRPDVGGGSGFRTDEPPVFHLAKFRCGSGTIFDEATSTCNFPERVNPNQKCVRKPESEYPSNPEAQQPAHTCRITEDASQVICIKDNGSNENMFIYNQDDKKSISVVARDILYRCSNPREIVSREFVGEFTLQPGGFQNIVARAVNNGECRKILFYDCKIAGVPAGCNKPPFQIDFTFEFEQPNISNV